MENLNIGGPPFLTLILLLVVSPFARDMLKMLGAIMAGIAGVIFLSPAFLVWKFSTLLSEYHHQTQADKLEKEWVHACSQHVYRGNAFKPTTPLVNKPESDQVSPPLVIAFFIAALVVGIHFGSNT
ncbi:hypothetical protein KBB85_03140 [Patescibacteria group bacterium]|nr:hypothetical protein [Patescibacteria group bacterium]